MTRDTAKPPEGYGWPTPKEPVPDCHGYEFRGKHDYRGTQTENRHCYHCGHMEEAAP